MVDTFFGAQPFNMDDAVDQVLNNLISNRSDLQGVINTVASGVGQGISLSDKGLSSVCARCKSTVTRQLNIIMQDMQNISQHLQLTVGTLSAEVWATLQPLWYAAEQGLQQFPSETASLPGMEPQPISGGAGPIPGMQPQPIGSRFQPSTGGGFPQPQPQPGPPPGFPQPYPPPGRPGPQPYPQPQPQPGPNQPPQPQPMPQPQPQEQPPNPFNPPNGEPAYFPPSQSGGQLYPPSQPQPQPLPVGAGVVTTLPLPGNSLQIIVQPCCPTPVPTPVNVNVEPYADERPESTKAPKVTVKGAGDDRPDDIEKGTCSVKGIVQALPKPGSDLWCAMQGQLMDALSQLGEQIIQWVGKAIQAVYANQEQWALQPDPAFNNPLHLPSDMFTLCMRGLARVAVPLLKSLWDYYCTIKRGIGKVGTCDSAKLVALYVVKATVNILKQSRWGWDGFAWATVDIALDMPSIQMAVEYLCNAACPYVIPEPAEADEAYLRGWITDDTYKCWLAAHGVDFDVHYPIVRAKREQLTVEQIIELGRRIGATEQQITDSLRFSGVLLADDAARMQTLYDELPTISDHLHWLQRNVFDHEYIADYKLLDGFDSDQWIQQYLKDPNYKQGALAAKRKFWDSFGQDLHAQGMKKEYAALHYAAHWVNPSPGQLFEMMRRLRPNRAQLIADQINAQRRASGQPFTPVTAKDLQFSETDLLRLLAEQDVAPYFRERMRAIAYVPFGLRFLRQVFDTRQISDDEAIERFQDLSYSPGDATILVASEKIRRNRTVATQTRGYTVPNIKTLYLAGKLKRGDALQKLQEQGYPIQVGMEALQVWTDIAGLKVRDQGEKAARAEFFKGIKDGLIVGVVSHDDAVNALITAGFSVDNAKAYMQAVVTNDRIALTKKGISQLHKGVMSGRLALAAAGPLLTDLGITPQKVNEYLNVWRYDLEAGKRVLSQAQIIKLATEGLLPLPAARQRLLNLGYDDADALLMLAEAQQRIAQTEQKVIDAEHKQASVQAKAVAAAIKANQAQLERLRKNLYSLGTPSQIGKWYVEGLVGAGWVRERLTLMGKISGDIDLMLLEWDQQREAKLAKKKK